MGGRGVRNGGHFGVGLERAGGSAHLAAAQPSQIRCHTRRHGFGGSTSRSPADLARLLHRVEPHQTVCVAARARRYDRPDGPIVRIAWPDPATGSSHNESGPLRMPGSGGTVKSHRGRWPTYVNPGP